MNASISFRGGGSLVTNIPERYTPDILGQLMIEPTGTTIITDDVITGEKRINVINLSDVKLIQLYPDRLPV